VDSTYYGDIIDRPVYWADHNRRIAEVGDALVAVRAQAQQNIRQLNTSHDLNYTVALGQLTSRPTDSAPDVSEFYQ
jgi:hypothetical protein